MSKKEITCVFLREMVSMVVVAVVALRSEHCSACLFAGPAYASLQFSPLYTPLENRLYITGSSIHYCTVYTK